MVKSQPQMAHKYQASLTRISWITPPNQGKHETPLWISQHMDPQLGFNGQIKTPKVKHKILEEQSQELGF